MHRYEIGRSVNAQQSSATWRKSSYSGGSASSDCVEVAPLTLAAMGVRDTKSRERGHVTITVASWATFLEATK
ncbi:DUF397 domain-containing protein [Embleya scabrispora]|uniref:DUF397 domain-containing protein n=1 Tax=Embleya scabrispora TaxID=159449 RepID=UPI00099F0834|nr:DUF397 domain-containing protein [Embleya scabrispora]MYS83326.1 DUF397 domain-containing protein [Streptomyces sp. SID5474]